MNKVCTRCGTKKPLEMFYIHTIKKDGLTSCCKECICKQNHKNWLINKERILERRRTRRMQCPSSVGTAAKYQRAYRQDNKDTIAKQKNIYNNGSALYSTYASQLDFAEDVKEGLGGELLVLCAYCGQFYIPANSEVRERIKSLNGKVGGENRLYCSGACKQACPSYGQRVHWKSQKKATSREVSAQFRQLVLERDSWICQRCGAGIEAELHVHHIEGAIQQPGMANDLENGITLCRECHKHAHSQDGCRYSDLRCPS